MSRDCRRAVKNKRKIPIKRTRFDSSLFFPSNIVERLRFKAWSATSQQGVIEICWPLFWWAPTVSIIYVFIYIAADMPPQQHKNTICPAANWCHLATPTRTAANSANSANSDRFVFNANSIHNLNFFFSFAVCFVSRTLTTPIPSATIRSSGSATCTLSRLVIVSVAHRISMHSGGRGGISMPGHAVAARCDTSLHPSLHPWVAPVRNTNGGRPLVRKWTWLQILIQPLKSFLEPLSLHCCSF